MAGAVYPELVAVVVVMVRDSPSPGGNHSRDFVLHICQVGRQGFGFGLPEFIAGLLVHQCETSDQVACACIGGLLPGRTG